MNKSNPITPNKLDVAKKQIGNKKGFSIPNEINENEKHLYHLIILDTGTRTANDEIVYKATVQKVNKESFARSSKNGDYQRLGLMNMFILHDPVDGITELGNKKETKTAAQVIEEIKAINSVEELNALKLTDTRKSVVEAIDSRITELGNN